MRRRCFVAKRFPRFSRKLFGRIKLDPFVADQQIVVGNLQASPKRLLRLTGQRLATSKIHFEDATSDAHRRLWPLGKCLSKPKSGSGDVRG